MIGDFRYLVLLKITNHINLLKSDTLSKRRVMSKKGEHSDKP
jgi:hypothetical protein